MSRPPMPVGQVLSILEETPVRLRSLTDGLAERLAGVAPEPGEWSATEILAHLRSCSDVWGAAIESIVRTDHPTIRAVSPTTWIKSTAYPDLGFVSSLGAFSWQRDGLLAILRPLPNQDWTRSATVLGGGKPLQLTVHSYANRLARHERTHWRQMAKTVEVVKLASMR